MIEFQNEWKKSIDNFHFVIGYSGKFIYRGNDTENSGDKYIIEQKGLFQISVELYSSEYFSNE